MARIRARFTTRSRCAARAEAGDELPDAARIGAAATAFRYARQLIAGADVVAWLDARGLTVDDWTAYLSRLVLTAEAGAIPDPAGCGAIDIPAVAFAADGICSGRFDEFAATLADRAAVADATRDERAAGPQAVERDHIAWLSALDPAERAARLDHLAEVDRRFELARREAVSDQALSATIAAHPFDWTRIDLERVSFSSRDAAHEAAMLIRHDGQSLTAVAMAAGRPVEDVACLFEDLAPEWQQAVLTVGTDDLVGPVAIDSRHEIAWLVGKAPPGVVDPIVRARAERAIVSDLRTTAAAARLRWIGIRFGTPDAR
jgi:hypothetical protein